MISKRELSFREPRLPRYTFSLGKMALLSEKGWFEGIQDCNLTMTSEEFFVNDVAFALPKNSWYTAIFSERYVVIHYVSVGVWVC